jgi:hypothetical protein
MHLIDTVWKECLKLSEYFTTEILTNQKALANEQQVALAIADSALRLSSFNSEPKEGLRIFIGRLTDVVKHCPVFAKHYRPLIQMISRIPAELLAEFPQLVCLLRAFA